MIEATPIVPDPDGPSTAAPAPFVELAFSLDPTTAKIWQRCIPRQHRQKAAQAALLTFCEVDPDERKAWTNEHDDVLFAMHGAGYRFFCPLRRLFVTVPAWLEDQRRQVTQVGNRTMVIGGDWEAAFFQVALHAEDHLETLLASYDESAAKHVAAYDQARLAAAGGEA